MKAAQDMMSKMSPEDMQNMMKMQQQMMSNPAMMQQAQQMMQNPAMAQQAANAMKNLSPDELRQNLKQAEQQMPKAVQAAPQTAVAKLKASAMAVTEDILTTVEEAEASKAAGNASFKAADFAAAAPKYESAAKLVDSVIDKKVLSGADKKAVEELKEACYLNLANCNLKLQDWDTAVAVCSSVLERGPNRKALFRRGDALHRLGKLEDARDDLEKAVKLDPVSACSGL